MDKKVVGAVSALVLVLAGCGKPAATNAAATAGSASASAAGHAAISVSTVRAVEQDYPIQIEVTGAVTSLTSVDVKPQISSTIKQVHFREGQFVKAGQLLFTLDARAAEIAVVRAQAQLQKDMASLADVQRQLARSRELLAQNFVSQVAVDTNQTLVDAQLAVVASDRAAIKAAQVDLSYTRIVAPNAGRAGSVNVYPGTLVQPGTASLVTITQLDPIAVSFNLPQRNLPDALQSLHSGGGKVTAMLPEGRGTLTGKLAFVDNAVDAGSGTVKVKAVFDNPNDKLWPGAFVGVRMAVRTLKGAIVIPQSAIVQGVRDRIVYVVDAHNRVQERKVELVHAGGADAVVTGVNANDRVVVDGRQNVRSGSLVVERPANAAGGQSAASIAADGTPVATVASRTNP